MSITHTPATESRIVTERMNGAQSSVEVIEYTQLAGSDNLDVAAKLFYASQVGMRLKQIKIQLQNRRHWINIIEAAQIFLYTSIFKYRSHL